MEVHIGLFTEQISKPKEGKLLSQTNSLQELRDLNILEQSPLGIRRLTLHPGLHLFGHMSLIYL